MKIKLPHASTLWLLSVVALLGSSGVASAQSKKVRPPVAGDGKYYALPGDTVVPQEFYVERPTLNNAGFEWYVSGDDNHNATVAVRFREVGESEWREGLPLLRIQNEKIWGHEQRDVYETPNMFAGSVFGLQPDTTYECEFTMSDPDGLIGVATNTESVTTRSVPKPYEHGKVYHVYPLGYEGTREEPAFTGLNEAYYGYNGSGDWWLYSEPRVKAGDTILVHAGLYKGERYKYANPLGLDFHGTYVLTQDGTAERPITIKAAGDGEVIFDGEGCYRLFDVMAADHHYFEGITVVNAEIAFYAGLKRVLGSSGLSVVNCKMDKVGQCVMTHWAGSNDFYIADNTMIGMHDRDRVHGWARVKDPAPITSYNAVKVYGQGHVVCHNYIAYYHDAICIDTHGRPEGGPGEHCASIDFYNNDIFLMADNFIETDGGAHNLRVYNNRGINVWHSALSSQPVFGGPAYFIRNVIHTAGDALKFSARPTGMIVYNNTFCTETRLSSYSNGHFRNNLFLGHAPTRPTLSSMSYTGYTSFDYNGYRKKTDATPLFQWSQPKDRLQDFTLSSKGDEMKKYQSLEAFSAATGQEKHGVMLDYDVLKGVEPPDPEDRARVFQINEFDFRLREGSAAVDAGCELPSLTDGFNGDAPDLGAYEFGKPLPVYGPRNGTAKAAPKDEAESLSLFDGETLGGWTATSDANWRVEDGVITADEGEAGLLVHADTYKNYELKLEFKAAKGCNSGVFLNTDMTPGDVGKNCYELNIADPNNPFPTGSLVKRVKIEGAGETDTWRSFEIRVVNDHITVQIRDGIYRIDKAFVFGLQDSGQSDSPITYAAYPGETPVFSAGREINGWQKVVGELPGLPAKAVGNVLVADVSGRFFTLYDDKGMLPRARSERFVPLKGSSSTRLHFPKGRLKNWPNVTDVDILVRPTRAWMMNVLPLASVDEDAGVAQTVIPATYAMNKYGCWVENVLEELDEPGEWVLNTKEGKVYLWPRGESPVVAPTLLELIRVEGNIDINGPKDVPVRNLCFRGLTFKHGERYTLTKNDAGLQHDWDMFDKDNALIRLRGTKNCVIEKCHFLHSGSGAIRVDLHGVGNKIAGNHIHHVGEIYWHSPGIYVCQSGENRVANNLIHHTNYTALIVSGIVTRFFAMPDKRESVRTIRWHEVGKLPKTPSVDDVRPFLHTRGNMIELNEIHHAMQILADGNGIYVRGAGPDNVIRRNYVHHLVAETNAQGAIRTDGGQMDTLIAENVIYKCKSQGMTLKLNNRFENNIIADVIAPRGTYLKIVEGPMKGASNKRNIFYSSLADCSFLSEPGGGNGKVGEDRRGRVPARTNEPTTRRKTNDNF